jgi:hypothetical protein
VDHELLHGKYLHRLSHEALSFYLFLVVVGDCEGKSFYGERSISGILRLSAEQFSRARQELITMGLIISRGPYLWVQNLKSSYEQRGTEKKDPVPAPSGTAKQQTNSPGAWNLAGSVLEGFSGTIRRPSR